MDSAKFGDGLVISCDDRKIENIKIMNDKNREGTRLIMAMVASRAFPKRNTKS